MSTKKGRTFALRVGQLLRHYKGGLYRVAGFATHTESEEKLVIYYNVDQKGTLWARPLTMFEDMVETERSGMVLRFVEADPPDK